MTAYRSGVTADDFHPDTRAFFAAKTVVVTGGAGFIGSHVVEQLLALGARPIVPTRRQAPRFLAHLGDAVERRQCDLTDRAAARKAFDGAGIILDLAATVGGIEYNINHPASVFQANMQPFLNTISLAAELSVERMLVTSSACVYPRHCSIPTPEEEGTLDEPEPTNAGYGWSKRMEEFLARAYAQEYGLSVAVARPYNAFGPRDDFAPATSHVLAALIYKAFRSEDGALPVWGDGSVTRSFLYVDDFARGLIEIAARDPSAEALNVGGDDEVSIGEAAHAVARIVSELRGRPVAPKFEPTEMAGQPRRKCDTTKLKQRLGFVPAVDLETGLRRTIEWFAEHENHAVHPDPQ